MMISAKYFDKVFTLLEEVEDYPNTKGQKRTALMPVGDYWCRLQYREENRRTSDGVEKIIQRPVFTTRYCDQITTNKKLMYEHRVYRIDSAIPSDNGEYTIIRAFIDDTK